MKVSFLKDELTSLILSQPMEISLSIPSKLEGIQDRIKRPFSFLLPFLSFSIRNTSSSPLLNTEQADRQPPVIQSHQLPSPSTFSPKHHGPPLTGPIPSKMLCSSRSRSLNASPTRGRDSLPSRILQRLRNGMVFFGLCEPKLRSVRHRSPTPHPRDRRPMRDSRSSTSAVATGDNSTRDSGAQTPHTVYRGQTPPLIYPSPRQLALAPDADDLERLEMALERQWTLRIPPAELNGEAEEPTTVRIRMVWFADEVQRWR